MKEKSFKQRMHEARQATESKEAKYKREQLNKQGK